MKRFFLPHTRNLPFERFLNLNGAAGPMLAGIFLIGAVIPGGLALLRIAGLQAAWIVPAQRVCLWLGGGLLALFVLLVIIEQAQDALLGAAYRRSLSQGGVELSPVGECPHCGNRQVKAFEHFCPVCGKKLH